MNILVVSIYDDGYSWSVALLKEDGTIVRFQDNKEIEDIITSFVDHEHSHLHLISYLSDYRIDKVIWCEMGNIDFYDNGLTS